MGHQVSSMLVSGCAFSYPQVQYDAYMTLVYVTAFPSFFRCVKHMLLMSLHSHIGQDVPKQLLISLLLKP